MLVDEKFNRRKVKRIEVGFSASMNLAPPSEWTVEENRVSLTLRDTEDTNYDSPRYLHISMSRGEAKRLGLQLLNYGNTPVQGEPGFKERY